MKGYVLDCSVAATWFFDDEKHEVTDELLRRTRHESIYVPSLWFLEIGNVFLLAVKKGRITQEQCSDAIRMIDNLPIVQKPFDKIEPLHEIMTLARTEKLTLYDASYLYLAVTESLALASLDRDLRKAARRIGVEVLPKEI